MDGKPAWDQVIAVVAAGCIDHDHEQNGGWARCRQCGRRLYQGTAMTAAERAEVKRALSRLNARELAEWELPAVARARQRERDQALALLAGVLAADRDRAERVPRPVTDLVWEFSGRGAT